MGKRKIDNFEQYVMVAKLATFTKDFDNAMAKENKKSLKRCWTLIPMVLLAVSSLIGSTLFALIFFAISIVGFSYELLKMMNDQENQIRKAYGPKEESIFGTNEEPCIEEVMAKGFSNKQASNHYTEGFKNFLAEYENTNNFIKNKPKFEVIDTNDTPLDKEQSISEIVLMIETYYSVYNLPDWKVSAKDFDTIMDTLYEHLDSNGKTSYYHELAELLWKMALAVAFIRDKKEFNSIDFVNNVDIVEDINSEMWQAKDTQIFRKKVLPFIKTCKVIKFNDALTQKSDKMKRKTFLDKKN